MEERSVNSFFRIQEEADNDSLLRVQVESSVQKTTFYVPVSLMLQREVEMIESAKRDGIDSERWSASRLFSLWKEKSRQDEITLLLTPEASMQNYSTLKWEPWLSSCIRAYYNTGTIRIPDDALGSEILLALEYFGILTTSADPFVFDSYDAFQRVKRWSDYFTLRDHIAAWVLEDFKAKGTGRRIWITSENAMDMVAKEMLLQVSGDSATVLSGGLESSGYGLSCRVVNGVFKDHGTETGNQVTREVPARMRQDFCDHLKRSLPPRTKVTFDICSVDIIKTSTGRHRTETRPVLKIRREGGSDSSSKNSHEGSDRSSAKKSERSKPSSAAGDNFGSSHEKQFKQAEKAILGTDSTDLSSVSSRTRSLVRDTLVPSSSHSSQQIAGKNAALGGSYRLQQHSTGSSGKVSARSKHDSSGSPSLMEKSQSAEMTYSNPSAVEQRHPQRSSPPPDERRVSPENVVDKKKAISDREFLQQIDAAAPIRFVNTSFGDLRSVTSGLSGTFMDESVLDAIEAREVPARKPAVQPPAPAPAIISEEQKASPPRVPVPIKSSSERKVDEEKLLKYLESIERESGDPDLSCNYWQKWLAGVCEAMIPGSGQDERPSSPVQEVTIPTAENAEETTSRTTVSTLPLELNEFKETTVKRKTPTQAARSNAPTQTAKEVVLTQTRNGSVPRKAQNTSYVPSDEEPTSETGNSCVTASVEGMTAKWLRSTFEGTTFNTAEFKAHKQQAEGTAPSREEMLQQAQTVVKNLSNDFDGLIKKALSSNSGESNSSSNQSEKKSRSIPNKLPVPPSKTSNTSGTERSVKVKNTLPPRSGDRARANPSKFGALVIDPIRSAEEGTKDSADLRKKSSDLSSKKVLITKTGSSSKKNMEFAASLPPREPRGRMRVNPPSIARKKKQSASAAPPQPASYSAGVSMNPSKSSAKSFRNAPMTDSSPSGLTPMSSISESTTGISEVTSSSKKSKGISIGGSIARRFQRKK
jgi:hypothetical protein